MASGADPTGCGPTSSPPMRSGSASAASPGAVRGALIPTNTPGPGVAAALGVTHVIFGDIMGDAHRAWDERVCAQHGLTPVLPIWGEPTRALVEEFIASGSTAVIVTARRRISTRAGLAARSPIDAVRELEQLGVDPCGEFGEYHTLVTGTPLFNAPLDLVLGAREMHSDCWALDVALSSIAPSPPVAPSHAPESSRGCCALTPSRSATQASRRRSRCRTSASRSRQDR